MRTLLHVSPRSCPPSLLEAIARAGWDVVSCRSLRAARALLRPRGPQVALLSLNGPAAVADAGADLQACIAAAPCCEWVGLFPPGALRDEGLRQVVLAHFFDHHTHPADPGFLCRTLGHAWGRAVLREPSGADAPAEAMGMVGHSGAMAELRRIIRRAGPALAPVLVAGESGSGKELVAQALHRCSPRADGPFVAINCGALPPTLIHSELFGHARGSFSGASVDRRGLIESARGGTLFLDEIAELPLEVQATLLRFLQENTIQRVGSELPTLADTRVVAASHVDLPAAVAAGRFREDLFYRLNVLAISVPPLRERREDIPLLALHVYERFAGGAASGVRGFGKPAMDAMTAHHWPGNVRELFNRVQRAVVMAEHRTIGPEDLDLAPARPAAPVALEAVRVHAERRAILLAMERAGRNISVASRDLGISRMTLYRLMAKHGVPQGGR